MWEKYKKFTINQRYENNNVLLELLGKEMYDSLELRFNRVEFIVILEKNEEEKWIVSGIQYIWSIDINEGDFRNSVADLIGMDISDDIVKKAVLSGRFDLSSNDGNGGFSGSNTHVVMRDYIEELEKEKVKMKIKTEKKIVDLVSQLV